MRARTEHGRRLGPALAAAAAATAAAALVACGGGTTDPTPPTPGAGRAATARFVAGDSQIVAAGDSSAQPYVVRVSDAGGRPVAGAGVYFVGASGAITGVLTTDAKGEVALRWRPRTRPGVWTPLHAYTTDSLTVQGTKPATAYGTTRLGPPAQFIPLDTRALPAATVGDTVRVRLRLADADSNPVAASLPVTWAAAAPAGVVQTATTTDADGTAAASVVVGQQPGHRTVTARAAFGAKDVGFDVAPGPVVALLLKPSRLVFFQIGETVPLTVTATDRFGNVLSPDKLLRSSDTTVAPLGYYTVTARGLGDATITASAAGLSRTLHVTVRPVTHATGACVRVADGTVFCRTVTNWLTPADTAAGPDTLTGYRPVADDAGRPLAAAVLARDGTCATTTDQATWCWGDVLGYMGLPTTSPVRISGGPPFTALDVGQMHACGLATDGSVRCWGEGNFGELGTRALAGCGQNRLCSQAPVPVEGGHAFTAIAAGGDEHTCALTADGAAWCWGANGAGQLGATGGSTCALSGTTFDCAFAPVAVDTDLRFRSVATGGYTTCGITTQGELWCWNWGSSTSPGRPRRVMSAYTFIDLTVGALGAGWSVCGVTSGGDVACASQLTPDAPRVVLAGRQAAAVTIAPPGIATSRVCARTVRNELVCADVQTL